MHAESGPLGLCRHAPGLDDVSGRAALAWPGQAADCTARGRTCTMTGCKNAALQAAVPGTVRARPPRFPPPAHRNGVELSGLHWVCQPLRRLHGDAWAGINAGAPTHRGRCGPGSMANRPSRERHLVGSTAFIGRRPNYCLGVSIAKARLPQVCNLPPSCHGIVVQRLRASRPSRSHRLYIASCGCARGSVKGCIDRLSPMSPHYLQDSGWPEWECAAQEGLGGGYVSPPSLGLPVRQQQRLQRRHQQQWKTCL